jgi:glutathione S-transferase
MMSELTLYDAASVPSPRRVKLCLFEKGLPFKIKWLNLGLMDQKQPSYLKLNPMGLVPTLVHDGKVLYESNVINEYLDAVFPNPPLVPKDAFGQARMRMWFAFENNFAKPFRDAVYETMGKERLQGTGITPEKLREEIGKRPKNEAYIRFATKVLTAPRDDAHCRWPAIDAGENGANGQSVGRWPHLAVRRAVHAGRHRTRSAR